MASSMFFSEDHEMLRSSVRRFVEERIQPVAAAWEETGFVPREVLREMGELGFLGIRFPERYGGTPLSYRCYLACVREISRACASTGIIWATNFHAVRPLIEFGTPALQQRLLPSILAGNLAALAITEPDAGSDATGMKTSGRTPSTDTPRSNRSTGGFVPVTLSMGDFCRSLGLARGHPLVTA